MSGDAPTRAFLIPLDGNVVSSGIRLSELLSALVRFKGAIFALGLICIAATLAVNFFATEKFRATTTVMVSDNSGGGSSLGALGSQLGNLASLTGIQLPSSSGIRVEALATLESRQLLRSFIVDEGLLPILFHESWDAKELAWDTETGDAPSIEKAVDYFQDSVLTIKREAGSDIVHLAVTWSDPKLCEQWANKLIDRLNADLRERANAEALKNIEFLEAELETNSNTRLQNAVFSLIEKEMAKIMLADVRSDYAFRVIDPAVAPDSDDPVSPRLLLLLVAAGCIWIVLTGLLLCVAAVRSRKNRTNM